MTYDITFYKTHNRFLGFFTNKVCKKVKANIVGEKTTGLPGNYMVIIYDNEEREILDWTVFCSYKLSKEFFLLQAQKVKNETGGQASVDTSGAT